MQDRFLKAARVLSIVAAVLIALACGSNYAYSTWAPQYAQRLKLSSTESNLIGSFGNLGMYIPAILVGILVDSKGPRSGVALGAVLLGLGYTGIYTSFRIGPGYFAVATLCFFSFITGCGSCAAFLAALKIAAINYPESRGTATGLPLAGFGLSAFMFSSISTLAFPDDTAMFLLMLAVLSFALCAVSFFFVRLLPPHPDVLIPMSHEHSDSQVLHRSKSHDSEGHSSAEGEPGVLTNRRSADISLNREDCATAGEEACADTHEDSSLLSKSTGSGREEYGFEGTAKSPSDEVDIRGLALLAKPQFWHLFLMFGLLTGIGLMNINNIGNDTQALWHHYDDTATSTFIEEQQSTLVCILSLASCAGRLLSGAGSDFLEKKLNMNRMWCLFASGLAFTAAQFSELQIENPHYLASVAALTGLAYGMLYGFFPSLMVQQFGVLGMSQNWGTMILAPVISGNLFNLLYGQIYDKHSVVLPDGERVCLEGLMCYRTAILVTLFAGLIATGLSLASIWRENRRWKNDIRARRRTNHDRDA